MVGLLAASRTSPADYLPLAALGLAASSGVVFSSLGMNIQILSMPRAHFTYSQLWRIVAVLGVVFITGCVIAVASSDWRVAGLLLAVVWGGTAFAGMGKADLLRTNRVRTHAIVEVASAFVAIMIFFAAGTVSTATTAGMLSLTSVYLSQTLLSFRRSRVFARGGVRPQASVFSSQFGAYANSNLDYLIAAPLLGSGFSIYSLAFRLSNAAQSQISNVYVRVFLKDYAHFISDHPESSWTSRLRAETARLLVVTVCFAVVSVPILALVSRILGPTWTGFLVVALLTTASSPMRAVLGIAGAGMVVTGKASELTRFEMARLIVATPFLVLGALAGIEWLALAAATHSVLSSAVLHRRFFSHHGEAVPMVIRALTGSTLVTLAAIVSISVLL